MNSITVYFDESGYTGENLLKEDQTTFSYASVKINNKDAEKLVDYVLSKYPKQTQNGELKAITLLKTDKGKQVIIEILHTIQDNIKISVSDKKFALAAKFFEYMIEPVIASKSSIFYHLDFHKYISNILYMNLVIGKDKLTQELFKRFEKLMRNKQKSDFENLLKLVDENINSSSEDFIQKLLLFIQTHKKVIWDEIKDLPKWTVDLSIMALNALFSDLGKNGDEIIAYCDNSKPIFEQKDIFNNMIGRTDILYSPFFTNENEKIPMTYNLKELNLVDSKIYKAIQLADIVAGTAAYIFNMHKMSQEQTDKFYIDAREIFFSESNILANIIFPDPQLCIYDNKSKQLNASIFEYLIEASKNKVDILIGLEDYILYIDNALDKHPFLESIK